MVNVVLFQAGWFVCVLGAARGWTPAPELCGPVVVALTLLLAPRAAATLAMVLACSALGLLVDGTLIRLGLVVFPAETPALLGVPFWIASLWLLFATTFDGCLRWLRGRPATAVVLGLIGSPLSYTAAERLDALTLGPDLTTLAAIGLGWGAMMPLQVGLAARIVGADRGPAS